jgi:hypothetical protein
MNPQRDIDRQAFNTAFYELGLRWHWDDATYDTLALHDDPRAGLRGYLQSAQAHLLRAYDADFLADAILDAKRRCQAALARHATPCAAPTFAWADPARGEIGI